jgi:hypothetical protein
VIGLDGNLLYLGQARRGSTHDTARADQIIEATAAADVELIADLGYRGAIGSVRSPIERKAGCGLSPRDQHVNREYVRVRCQGERGFAQLKAFKVLRRVRISPSRITTLAHSIHSII